MKEFVSNSMFFGVTLSLAAYAVGILAKRRLKLFIFNPLLVAIALTIAVLLVTGIEYDAYNSSAKYLSYLLTPATICLAIPLYEQYKLLKKNFTAIIVGIASGVLTSLTTIFLMALLFKLGHYEYITLLPKSITTAIGIGLSQELEGYVSITVASIMITGLFGNIAGDIICKVCGIKHPVARGIALGTSAHVMGTAKALQMGQIEGAMSSLSVAVAGCMTVAGAILYSTFI
ncbi:MAG: LrgB family protein [Bacteroidaceae bacterium]|nr:LrgB family protein [Bacteroidaceae bacterium]MBQ5818116.1 LrgB family protein [Bacteroidaceae bacterium]